MPSAITAVSIVHPSAPTIHIDSQQVTNATYDLETSKINGKLANGTPTELKVYPESFYADFLSIAAKSRHPSASTYSVVLANSMSDFT